MASLIKGITVILYEETQTGVDAFHAPVFQATPVEVENVLVCPVTAEAIVSDIQLYGKKSVYELCIPKGDAHVWEDRKVEFFGQVWKTFGFVQQWIEENVPLDWNMKIRVERYG